METAVHGYARLAFCFEGYRSMKSCPRSWIFPAFSALAMLAVTLPAQSASLRATVDLSQQRMYVTINGKQRYSWRVSTGKRGWETRPGSYTPFAQREKFYSSKWKMSLPYLTWIGRDGTAIHGTYLTKRLGRTASHGCIRLSIGNARTFYRLVEKHGFWGTEVIVKR
jgi:lipoprotein-anchoring transpeptidase ErfK/SrfK